MTWRRSLRWLERGALIIGLLSLGLWANAQLRTWAFQSAESKKLATATPEVAPPLAKPLEQPTAPRTQKKATAKTRKSSRPVTSLGRIEIRRLGIEAVVAEGADARTLDLAVGHIPSTASLGSAGNCGLAGHRDTFFRNLKGVRDGDVVHLTTRKGTYTYEVEWSRVVKPDRIDTLDPTKTPSLTLVTCYPFTFVGRAPQRFVVRARQVDGPPAPVARRFRAEQDGGVLMAEGH